MSKDTTLEAVERLQDSTVDLVARIALRIEALKAREREAHEERVRRLAEALPTATALMNAALFKYELQHLARGSLEQRWAEAA